MPSNPALPLLVFSEHRGNGVRVGWEMVLRACWWVQWVLAKALAPEGTKECPLTKNKIAFQVQWKGGSLLLTALSPAIPSRQLELHLCVEQAAQDHPALPSALCAWLLMPLADEQLYLVDGLESPHLPVTSPCTPWQKESLPCHAPGSLLDSLSFLYLYLWLWASELFCISLSSAPSTLPCGVGAQQTSGD